MKHMSFQHKVNNHQSHQRTTKPNQQKRKFDPTATTGATGEGQR